MRRHKAEGYLDLALDHMSHNERGGDRAQARQRQAKTQEENLRHSEERMQRTPWNSRMME